VSGAIVSCKACGAMTDIFAGDVGAVAAWNRRADGWISVTDRLPDAGVEVLTYCVNVDDSFGNKIVERDGEAVFDILNKWVTHWQPLPEPPCR
jgi:hypothetical protein